MEMESQQLFDLLAQLSIPGVVGLIVIALWKGGILEALASWTKKGPDSSVARDFYAFKEIAETNHYHDLDDLLKGQDRIWASIEELRRDTSKNSAGIGYLMGRIKNGHNK